MNGEFGRAAGRGVVRGPSAAEVGPTSRNPQPGTEGEGGEEGGKLLSELTVQGNCTASKTMVRKLRRFSVCIELISDLYF